MSQALVASLILMAPFGSLTHVRSLTEQLRSPARAAVTPDGTLLVTDTFKDHIARFDSAGNLLGTWPVPTGPIGIAAHPTNGNYYVSLRDEGKVAIYDSSFTFTGSYLGEDAEPPVTFVRPTDIDVDTGTGNIYVADADGDRICAFSSDGTATTLILGIRGGGASQFRYPSALAIDETNDRLIVADHDNFRIQAFHTSGIFETLFGYRLKFVGGGSEGWMPRTQGVAVDGDGRIYVADAFMSSVRVFDPDGTELEKSLEYGFGPGDLRTPCDLELSADGSTLYVVNTNASAVEVYTVPDWDAIYPEPLRGPNGGNPPGTNFSEYDARRTGTAEPLGQRGGKKPRRMRKSGRDEPMPPGELPGYPGGSPAFLGSWDGPHMIDSDVVCGRCHGFPDMPGGAQGSVAGQGNMCMSCHTSGGQGLVNPVHSLDVADPYGTNPDAADGRGVSHAWGVLAVNPDADSVGPRPGGVMERYLRDGEIKCATCHNQHNTFFEPYLRVNNRADLMCKECHAARAEGLGELGTHPVGFDYPGGQGEFPDDAEVAPLFIKDQRVECMTCHGLHNADSGGANDGEGDGNLLRAANDESLCQVCHTEHTIHTPHGDWLPTCQECHDTHNPAAENLSLVATVVRNQTLGEDKPVVFTATSGAGSFADDDATYDGICQVCHTETSYHRHDGTGTPHNEGTTCTMCHPHQSGFMPTGGDCTACHNAPQDNGDGVPVGGRRAVVGEFPASDAHAHYGAELDSGACTLCHDMTTHMNGYVELLDPDDGSLYSFVRPEDLVSDPDLSDFCAGCHDADGAARLASPFDPFGNGNTPPDVATRFLGTLQWDEWYGDFCFGEEGTLRGVNSHHDISDGDQAFSGAKLECLNCHGAHTSSATQPLADPFATTTPWTEGDNAFCLSCHDGGNGPADPDFPATVLGPTVPLRAIDSCEYTQQPWYVDHTWTHAAHGLDSKRGWQGYSGAPSYELSCMDCHDPHGSYTDTNTLGNPYMIRDEIDGTMYVDDGIRPGAGWTGPPWDTFGVLRTDVVVGISGVTVDWGGPTSLCGACHAGWVDAYSWHAMCYGCQTCHGHGQAFGEYDWGTSPGDESTPCPLPPFPGDSPGMNGGAGNNEGNLTPHRIQGGFPGD